MSNSMLVYKAMITVGTVSVLHLRQTEDSGWKMEVQSLALAGGEHRTRVSEDISKYSPRGRIGAAML